MTAGTSPSRSLAFLNAARGARKPDGLILTRYPRGGYEAEASVVIYEVDLPESVQKQLRKLPEHIG